MNYTRTLQFIVKSILKRWRMIAIIAFVVAIAFGALKGFKEIKRIQTPEPNIQKYEDLLDQAENRLPDYKNSLTQLDAEIVKTKDLVQNTTTIELSRALFSINILPVFAENTNETQKLEQIEYIYSAVINNDSLYQSVIDELNLGINTLTLRRLVNFNFTSGSIQLTVKGFEKSVNEKIRENFIEKILEVEESLNASGEVCKINLISKTSFQQKESVYTQVFDELDMERLSIIENTKEAESLILSYKKAIDQANKINIASLFVYVIMGLICGIALAILIAAVMALFDKKVYSAADITQNFDLPLLGETTLGEMKANSKKSRFIYGLSENEHSIFSMKNLDCVSKYLEDVAVSKLMLIIVGTNLEDEINERIQLSNYSKTVSFTASEEKEVIVTETGKISEADLQASSDVVLGISYGENNFKQIDKLLTTINSFGKKVIGYLGITRLDGE